jgi:Flp pilus assembly protein protease CpaA
MLIRLIDALIVGALLLAAIEDIRGMQVRNAYPGFLLSLSLGRVALSRPPFLQVLTGVGLVFGVLYVFWHFGGIGGADVKILTALAVGEGMGIWVVLLVACAVFIAYALVLRRTREALPFVPAICVGYLLVWGLTI